MNLVECYESKGVIKKLVKRVKRKEENQKKEERFEKEICKEKDDGEWLRIVEGEGEN